MLSAMNHNEQGRAVLATRNRQLNVLTAVEERPLEIEVDGVDLDTDHLEAYLLQFLADEEVQSRIRSQLQMVIRDELSKLSVLFREALRDWIRKEKERFGQALTSTVDRAERERQISENQRLEQELKKTRREMELKAHENQILMQALEKTLRSPSKKP
jgi:hypothetical protein